MTICVSGCITDGTTPAKLTVALPPAPTFMAPIGEPVVKAGDDARLGLRKYRAAFRNANGRLAASAPWYAGVRKRYSGK